MSEFRIQYEIQRADYAEANATVVKRSLQKWEPWCLLGAAALLIVLPLAEHGPDERWTYPFLVIPFAVFLVYFAFLYLFPAWNARRYYSHTNLAKNTFTAFFSPERVKVEGQHVAWVIEWPGFKLIRESERLFVFYDGFTMFIFAKRYFAADQISGLKQLIQERWSNTGSASA